MSEKSWDRLWDASPLEVLQFLLSGGYLKQAAWHPLGFVHVELDRNLSSAYRFHIWPPGERRSKKPNWQIHNHVFSLTSKVLAGSIENRVYEVVDVPQGEATNQLYEVAYGSASSELLPTGRFVMVVPESAKIYYAPATYEVSCGVFHESFVKHADVVATLVRTDFTGAASPLVVGEINQRMGHHYEYHRVPVDQTDLNLWLHLALVGVTD